MGKLEEWRQVVGFENYEVSNLGGVRTFMRVGGHGSKGAIPRAVRQVVRAPKPYKRVMISDGVKKRWKFVHVLVLEAFIGPAPAGMECRHDDGVGGNNYLTNLSWSTHETNMADQVRHGTSSVGEGNGRATLNDEQVTRIRCAIPVWKFGMLSSFAREFGVSATTILRVKSNKSWSHV